MNFGFPSSSNYAQSQVSSSTTQYDTNYTGIENGGLFSREECRNLARYLSPHSARSSKPTTATTTVFARPSRWRSGWSTATAP